MLLPTRHARAALIAVVAALAAQSGAVSPALAAGTQTIDATIPLTCPNPLFGGQTWSGESAVARVKGTVAATTSLGELILTPKITLSLRFLDNASGTTDPSWVFAGQASTVDLFAAGGIDNFYDGWSDTPFSTTARTGDGWGPIDIPLSLGILSRRTNAAVDTPVYLSRVELTAATRAPGSTTPPAPRTCTPLPGGPPIAVIANDPAAPAPPVVTSISPATGSVLGGTTVTIKGANFATGPTPQVKIGATRAPQVTVIDDSTLRVITPPARAFGPTTSLIQVGTRTSDERNSPLFTYGDPDRVPVITSLSPTSGPPGTVITVRGTGLADILSVELAGFYLGETNTGGSDTQLQLTVPDFVPPGSGDLILASRFGTSINTAADDFTITAPDPLPTVSYVTPTTTKAGVGGTLHFVVGKGLDATRFVKVGTKSVRPLVVLNGQVAIFEAPAQAAGTYRVTITTKDGRSASTPSTLRYR